MSVVIIGGNECMTGKYKALCEEFGCKAKVYPKLTGSAKNIGSPDLLVLFTSTMSHKLLRTVMSGTKGQNLRTAHCRTGSIASLRSVLTEHTGGTAHST